MKRIETNEPGASGGVILWKPKGIGSRRALDEVERMLGRRPLGYIGTLDPLACGILVAVGGEARKFQDLLLAQPKRYLARVCFGIESATCDLDRGLFCRVPGARSQPALEALRAHLAGFCGRILQRPPEVSALRIGGKRAHARARDGESLELPAREVEILSLELSRYEPPWLELDLLCGSGFYVRALARDLGERFGCGAVLGSLRRTEAAGFHEADAVPLGTLDPSHWLPLEQLVARLPRVEVAADCAAYLGAGRAVEGGGSARGRAMIWSGGRVIGCGEVTEGMIHPRRWLSATARR